MIPCRRHRTNALEPVVSPVSELPTIHELGLIPDHKGGENIKIREDGISRLFSDAPENLVREPRILNSASEYHSSEQRRCLPANVPSL